MTKKFNYGYLVAVACFLMAFFYVGYANNSGSLYVVPVTEHYGFSRAEFSLIFSIISIVSMFANLGFAPIYKRLGVKKLITLGMILCALAYFVYYKASNLIMFYSGAFLFGIGFTYTNMVTFTLLINSWFKEKRGTILGAISAGSGFGGSVMSPIIGYLIASYGFKQSYLLTAIILSLLIIPIVLMTKLNPETEEADVRLAGKDYHKKSIRELLKEQSVFLCLLIIFMMGFAMAPWLNIIASHIMDRGFDEFFASQVLGATLFIMGISKIIIGAIHDRAGIKVAMGICLSFFLIGMILLLTVSNQIMVWFFALFFGISLSALSVLIPLFITAMAGEDYLTDIMGIAQALIVGGMAFSTPLVNLVYDIRGTNNLAIVAAIILGISNILLTAYAFTKVEKKSLQVEGSEVYEN